MIPSPRQGPCSGRAREGTTPGVTAKTSGLLSAGASEKQVENSVGGPGQARARVLGRGGAGKLSLIPPVLVGVENGGDEARVANPASPVRMASRAEELFREDFSLTTGGDHGHRGRPPGRRCPTRGRKGWIQPKSKRPVLRRWYFMVGFCENLAKLPANAVPHHVVEVTHASTNALVHARVWRRHNELLGAAVLEKAGLLHHHKLLRARIRHVVHDKRRGGPPRKT